MAAHSTTFLGQLSIPFIPSGELNNIFQSHVGLGARVLVFSLEKGPTLFLKIPLFMLIYCCYVWENVCAPQAGMWFKSVMCCRYVSVSAASVSFSPWPVASGLSHSLPCHNKHSAAVFHLTCTHSTAHTHMHQGPAYTFWLFLTSLSCRRGEEAEIRSKRAVEMDKVRWHGALKACVLCFTPF